MPDWPVPATEGEAERRVRRARGSRGRRRWAWMHYEFRARRSGRQATQREKATLFRAAAWAYRAGPHL